MGWLNYQTRAWARFLPPIAWAIIIDLADIFSNAITVLLSAWGFTAPVGLALDTFFDALQTGAALLIFQDPLFAIANVDFILPQGFDIFPGYTIKVIAAERGWLRG